MQCVIVNPNMQDEPASAEEAHSVVILWRDALATALGADLQWDEAVDGDYFTDKPAWDCYWALVLHASREVFPNARRRWWSSKDPCKHPAYLKSCAAANHRYSQLMGETEIWIPLDQNIRFKTKAIPGNSAGFGTTYALLRQLDDLNARTWKASSADTKCWLQGGAAADADEDCKARFGFAVMHSLASRACERRLPMLLDY